MKPIVSGVGIFLTFLTASVSSISQANPAPVTTPTAAISVREAEEFCLKHWFPALHMGPGATAAQIEERLSTLIGFYTKNVELIDPNNLDLFKKPVLSGRSEILPYYRAILTHYPEWRFEIRAIYPIATGFVLHYTGFNAPPVASFDGVDILHVERGPEGTGPGSFRIRKLEEFYDRLPFKR
jgi:hypothetical protein